MSGARALRRDRFGIALGVLTAAGLTLRLVAARQGAVISRDGIEYLRLGEQVLAGRWDQVLGHYYPPGLPVLLAGGGALAGGLDEAAALATVALASCALVPAVGLVAWRAFGRGPALLAALLAAVLPLFVELGGEVLADGPYLALVTWALLLAQRTLEGDRGRGPAAAGAAVCAGAAYLVRPEGLIVLGALAAALLIVPRPASWRRRLSDLAWLLLPAALAVLPYALAIAARPGLEGDGAAAFKLTLKRDLFLHLAAFEPRAAAVRAAEVVRYGVKALAVAAPLVVLGAWTSRPPGERGPGRRLALLGALTGAGLLAAFALVRADRRFGAQLALLALPHAGAGAWALVGWLRRRAPWPGLRRRALPAVALAAVALSLPFVLRPRHTKKVSYRRAGALLRSAGAERVLAHDSRAAYYAGAEALDTLVLLPDPADRARAEALAATARRERADALIVVVDDATHRAASRELSRLLRLSPTRIRREGAVPLDLFLLR